MCFSVNPTENHHYEKKIPETFSFDPYKDNFEKKSFFFH